ncbi:MAG: NAD-dependent DNA ligase LigA [Lachnospiraceae bacterium]|nr:NAD-dependent DNA ligase LigA [Lachnospiraceae bacterium]
MAEQTERTAQNGRIERMRQLVSLLREASKAYYAEDAEIMSNREYDALYDELEQLEAQTGMVLAGSPTITVGYEAVEELPKQRHEQPMLSLAKTKEREELRSWLGDKEGLLSWKLDGLTIVLTYENGQLTQAVTRGNGEVGEVITNNAKVFVNVPLAIPFKGSLVLRGEAVITYSDFEKINREIEDVDAKYKNPRNLCSGSVRQLSNAITARRRVRFYAFSLVQAVENGQDAAFDNSREQQFLFLKEQGFDVVEYHRVTAETILGQIEEFSAKIETYDIPSDGLVLIYDDIAYGRSLGRTAKFPRDSIAFKWQDEIRETTLTEIEWSPSRTGLINPVAIFEPVELEGTTVSRASVHNISIMKGLELGIGDQITVYKANMIIPQIAENLTRSGVKHIPEKCPACGGRTEIRSINEVESLYCTNPDCEAKRIKAFTLLVSRDALNIDGLSEATLEKLIAKGLIHSFADMFHLDRYKEQITGMEGFGEKSYQNLMESIEKARSSNLVRVVYGLGIAGIGLANAKMLCRQFDYDIEVLRRASEEQLAEIDGIGSVLAKGIVDFFSKESNNTMLDALLAELSLEKPESSGAEQMFAGKVFVVTGSVEHFANRNELKAVIEERGGKVTGSVTSKTDYLINNDVNSTSGKNKKAKELSIPIISEDDFLAMMEGR